MMRICLWGALLLATLPAAAQRAKVTKATVFKEVDGRVISKNEFKTKLRTGRFAVYDYQSLGRAFGTATPAFNGLPAPVSSALWLPKARRLGR